MRKFQHQFGWEWEQEQEELLRCAGAHSREVFFSENTKDQIAKVMLLYGSKEQQEEVLDHIKKDKK
jgi:hypothetical protein